MKKLIGYISMFIITAGCREKFYADLPSPATGYLIVEGIINVGDDAVTVINLSRSTELDNMLIKYEENAEVYIENRSNQQISLSHTGNGRYETQPIHLPVNDEYRLHIYSAGKEYVSTFTESKVSPEIDSLYWVSRGDGLDIMLDTHDPQNNSRYYSWSFTETWEYHTPYYASLKYNKADSTVELRAQSDPQIFTCWSTAPSTSIVVASTVQLTTDNVYGKKITFVSATANDKLVEKYSIEVKQSVLSKDAFEYYERMRRNTEQTGSIFDAQPSQLRGNISCSTDSSEIVVGFISTSSITEKRIFIPRKEIDIPNIPTLYETCLRDTIANRKDSLAEKFHGGAYLPIEFLLVNNFPAAVIGSTDYCVDCRIKGGTNVRPTFWR